MPTLNLKDPEVYRLARELADLRHTTATGAVRSALRETLDRDRSHKEGLAERLMAIGRRSAARPEPFLCDEDLYDEQGLPT